ncbi:Replication protein P [Pseudomonas cichorii]|uniref:replication protein P n=1 Tax=Pseudomonas cichorii TaxID=36746 RepID=UPI001C89E71A|nr:replication protein P [Pseudomonas cichorii]MBX8528531.1 Replication protein P [Pseudomonas cichorii]
MKSVAQLIPGASRAIGTTQPYQAPAQPLGEVDDATGEVVERLFRQLQAIFPAYKQAWPDDKALASARRSWTKGFIAARINTIDQIRFGIEQCRMSGSPFAPSVGQFIRWCKPTPEMLGIPSTDKAFREALLNLHPGRSSSRQWSHSAVRHAALQCEMHNLTELEPDKAMDVFERAYEITVRMLVDGLPLDDIAIGIGHDGQKSEFEIAQELSDRVAIELIALQGIPADGAKARELLLEKFGKGKSQ